jgi:hypothetical protein
MQRSCPVCYLFFIAGLLSLTTVVRAESIFGQLDFTIGGRVKLDAVYNDQSVSKGTLSRSDLAFSPGSIPVTGSNTDSFNFNLRESRLWATSHLPLYNRDLAAYAEIDFFPIDRNDKGQAELSNKPRLRHAYATYAGFTAGRTYTAFLNVSAYPEVNDGNGPVGILNVRQELLRYSKSFAWGNALLSLEEPDSKLTTTTGKTVAADDADWVPDIITRLEFSGDWGNWSVATMAREIRNDGLVSGTRADSQWGAALSIAGRIYTTGQDNFRLSAAYGNVLGRYLSFNAFDDGVMNSNGQIDLTEIFGTYIAYQHWWNMQLRSSVTVGYAQAEHNLSVAPDTVDRRFYSTHLNLIWSPTLNSSVGAEWLHGYRELEDGSDGNLNRLQLTLIYKF